MLRYRLQLWLAVSDDDGGNFLACNFLPPKRATCTRDREQQGGGEAERGVLQYVHKFAKLFIAAARLLCVRINISTYIHGKFIKFHARAHKSRLQFLASATSSASA